MYVVILIAIFLFSGWIGLIISDGDSELAVAFALATGVTVIAAAGMILHKLNEIRDLLQNKDKPKKDEKDTSDNGD